METTVLTQRFTENYTAYLPQEHSLNFFVQCSEARLRRLKHGTRLTDVVQSHHNIYLSPASPTRLLPPTCTQAHLLTQAALLGLHHTSPSPQEDDYYPWPQLVTGTTQTSPALRTYQRNKLFRPELERQKHRFLPNYFLERYSLLSDKIDGGKRKRTNTNNPFLSHSESSNQTQTDRFVGKIDEIDAFIRAEMQKNEENRRKEADLKAKELRFVESFRRTEGRNHQKPRESAQISEFLSSAVYPSTPKTETTAVSSPGSLPIVFSPQSSDSVLFPKLTFRKELQRVGNTPSTRIKKAVARALDFA